MKKISSKPKINHDLKIEDEDNLKTKYLNKIKRDYEKWCEDDDGPLDFTVNSRKGTDY